MVQEQAAIPAGALSGVRVLDLTRILAGPTSTQLLGDLGADVIKVEKLGAGDDTRKWGPPYVQDSQGKDSEESAYYLCANRNKRSLAVDIAKPEGAELIRQLAQDCDVLIENFKVGGLAKYGLAYEDLKESHPHLVYCSISGFGQTGPNAKQPGYDIMAQGYGGIMSITGEPEGEPMKVGVGIADVMCGMYATVAILAALRHRDATGEGQQIDLALVDAQIAWLVNGGTNYLLSGQAQGRLGNQHPNIVPYQVFETADGHVIIAVGNDQQYQRFCQVVGLPHLAEDARFARNSDRLANREVLIPLIEQRLRDLLKEDLLKGLKAQSVPAGPVNSLPEVFASEQVAAREMKISMLHHQAGSGRVDLIGNPLKLSKTPVTYRYSPPTMGQHSDEILTDLLQLDEQQISQLREKDVV
ncbi:CaiB/BaiF CoA transferase family protein [Rhodovibrionaceae bacterium A322]